MKCPGNIKLKEKLFSGKKYRLKKDKVGLSEKFRILYNV
jgi:hypothetical protein